MTKNQTVDLLRSQLPGFYSVEQVINLIEKMEEEQSAPKLTLDQVRELTHNILASIQNEASSDNIVCLDDIEFELTYDRRIEARDAPINFDVIRDCVEQELTEYFEEEEKEDLDLVELEREE